jgi:predicted hydrocarbon binding protein
MSAIRKLKRLREALKALDVDEKRGVLTAYGERFLFIPLKLIHSIEDRLTENLGPVTATSFQYEIGKEGGREYMRMARKAGYDITDVSDVRKLAERLGTLGGWGKLTVTEVNLEKRITRVRWTNGVSVRNKKGKTPVCHFGRGILTGCAEIIFGKSCESLEVLCEGKGDPYCEAVIGDAAEIELLADSLDSGS